MRYTISNTAYWTVVLHAARYPQLAISGVLLGKTSEAGVAITGALALFHTQVFAPMLEVALLQVQSHAKCGEIRSGPYQPFPVCLAPHAHP